MGFNFLPEWLDHEDVVNVADARTLHHQFEMFIIDLFTLVAARETAARQGDFVCRIDFHKLQEEEVAGQCNYFFRLLRQHATVCEVIPIAAARQRPVPPLRIQWHGAP